MRGPSEQHGRKALPPSNSNTSSIFPRGIHSPLLPSPLVSTLTSNNYYKKTVLLSQSRLRLYCLFPRDLRAHPEQDGAPGAPAIMLCPAGFGTARPAQPVPVAELTWVC